MSRQICQIAAEIRADWKDVNFGARPYLKAMAQIDSIRDRYLFEDGREVVTRFLCNAGTWRGETARRIKEELNSLLNQTPAEVRQPLLVEEA